MWLELFGITILSCLSLSVEENKLTTVRTYLNMTKNEFRDKCNAKSTEILLQLKERFINFKDTLYENTKVAKMEIINDNTNFFENVPENLIKKHCFKNNNITRGLEMMFDLAQTCLEPTERFNNAEKENYLKLMTRSTCSFMTFASVFPCRIGENNETVTYEAPIENCLKRYFKVHGGDYGEPAFFSLPFAKS